MGHSITALLVPVPCDAAVAVARDLVPVRLPQRLTLLHLDHYYTAYWQATRGVQDLLDVPDDYPATFPREGVVSAIVCELTGDASPTFALVMTDYFGGVGGQWACAFADGQRVAEVKDINAALGALGVVREGGLDEFDTIGLRTIRSRPEYLERYVELCDALGV